MNHRKIAIPAGIGALAIIVIGIGIVTMNKDNDKQPVAREPNTTTTTDDNTTTPGGSGASTQLPGTETQNPQYETIEQAEAAVGFNAFSTSQPLQSEEITEIYSTMGLSGGNEQSLYISYGANGKMLYQLIQLKQAGPVPELPAEVEKVELTVNGKKVTGSRNEFWDESTPADQIYAGTPRQTISFVADGVGVDISEYGDLSLAQLKQIIERLSQR